MHVTEIRPDPYLVKAPAELKRWYWTKAELTDLARYHGLTRSGSKFEVLDRIATFLETGEIPEKRTASSKQMSKFDWGHTPLALTTTITDNYRNTQNVRAFFQVHIGPSFQFTIAFMEWMKNSAGRPLSEAVTEYERQVQDSLDPSKQTTIKPHNQYNRYMRDFIADNPSASISDARKAWNNKRKFPTKNGLHFYQKDDLWL